MTDRKPETAAVKRKIAAILAADVYGYSRLMAEDEDGVLRRLAACRAVFDEFVEKAGGRIFNTAGDSVMCEFESAVEAVRCAVDIQEALRSRDQDCEPDKRLVFRIGISIGDVVERNGDLLGDGVNMAARLESIAEPGGIVVSRSVHEAVGNKVAVAFQDLGAREVKNLAPVHAFAVAPEGTRLAAPKTATVPPPMTATAPSRPPETAPARPFPVGPAVAAGLAALALAGAGGWFLLTGAPAAPPPIVAAAPATPRPAEPGPAEPPRATADARSAPAPSAAAPLAPPVQAPPAVEAAREPALPLVVEELRAAPGRSCADLVFGGVQPARTPVSSREDGSPAPSHPSGLCGLSLRLGPGGERLGFKLDPAVTAAGIVLDTKAGAGPGEFSAATVMFRQNVRLPARHAIEIVDRRAEPASVRRLVHEIGAGSTDRLAQPGGAPALR